MTTWMTEVAEVILWDPGLSYNFELQGGLKKAAGAKKNAILSYRSQKRYFELQEPKKRYRSPKKCHFELQEPKK